MKYDNVRVLIVEARFYSDYSDLLLAGAKAVLEDFSVSYDVVTVAGALEIPAAIAFASKSRETVYDGYIALGCIIRGETWHFEIVANESARGLMTLSIDQGLAIGNGILTVDTDAQALARADMTRRNKGGFVAKAVLDLIAVKRQMEHLRG